MPKKSKENDVEKERMRKEIEKLKAKLEELNMRELKEKAQEKKEDVEEFVRKKPLLSLAIAVGAGMILGKLLRD